MQDRLHVVKIYGMIGEGKVERLSEPPEQVKHQAWLKLAGVGDDADDADADKEGRGGQTVVSAVHHSSVELHRE